MINGSKPVIMELASPRTTEETSAIAITRRRPMRSEMMAQGVTASANPKVAADTVSAAWDELIFRSAAMLGKSPWTEYSWEKVATPPANNASNMPR